MCRIVTNKLQMDGQADRHTYSRSKALTVAKIFTFIQTDSQIYVQKTDERTDRQMDGLDSIDSANLNAREV